MIPKVITRIDNMVTSDLGKFRRFPTDIWIAFTLVIIRELKLNLYSDKAIIISYGNLYTFHIKSCMLTSTFTVGSLLLGLRSFGSFFLIIQESLLSS